MAPVGKKRQGREGRGRVWKRHPSISIPGEGSSRLLDMCVKLKACPLRLRLYYKQMSFFQLKDWLQSVASELGPGGHWVRLCETFKSSFSGPWSLVGLRTSALLVYKARCFEGSGAGLKSWGAQCGVRTLCSSGKISGFWVPSWFWVTCRARCEVHGETLPSLSYLMCSSNLPDLYLSLSQPLVFFQGKLFHRIFLHCYLESWDILKWEKLNKWRRTIFKEMVETTIVCPNWRKTLVIQKLVTKS